MKKILAIVLAVVMLLPVFAVNVFAADTAMNLVVTSGRVTLKLDDVVKAGESVDIHIKGTTDGAFRFCLSDAASKGSGWNQSNIPLVMVANGKINNGAFDVTETLTATADAQYFLVSDGSWHFGEEATFTKLIIESVECNGKPVSFDSLNTNAGSAKLEEPAVPFGDVFVLDCGEEGIYSESWDPGFVPADQLPAFKNALSMKGSKLITEIDLVGWGHLNFIVADTAAGKDETVTIDLGWQTKGTVNYPSKQILDEIQKKVPNATFNDIKDIVVNSGGVTYKTFKVFAPEIKDKVSSNLAFVYVTDEYHAVLIRGRFLAMPHTDIGGYCPMCHAVIESEATDQSVLVLETTGGQDYQDAPGTFADGVVLVDAENNGNARIATNWIDGGKAWNAVVKAIPTEGAWLKVTYTGKLNGVIFQTEKTSAPEAFETTAPAVVEEGEKNVAWFNCADIVANSPVALSGDIGGWANFMLNFEGDTTVYGFEVLVPAEAPVAE